MLCMRLIYSQSGLLQRCCKLNKTVCRIAAKCLLSCVLKKQKEMAGLLLKTARASNNLDLSVNNLGERFQTVGCEPFFFDTAYTLYKRTGAIPADESGSVA